jgi:hypothetical protein
MPAAVMGAMRPTGWEAREGLWSKALLRTGLTAHRKRLSQQRLLGHSVSKPISQRRCGRPHSAGHVAFSKPLDFGSVRWEIAGENIDIKDDSPGPDLAGGRAPPVDANAIRRRARQFLIGRP